ncbi:MAG TPA: S8 family serine peptidase [Candidatus Acidoferrales bacterium]|nr:S8 family serine peptidase [Candidatus Acidoferrales bacterium]
MKQRIWVIALLIAGLSLWATPASAQLLGGLLGGGSTSTSTSSTPPNGPTGGVIVRTILGPLGLNLVCLLNNCTVVGNLDGGLNQVFLVKPATGLLPQLLAQTLQLVTGIVDAEVDQTGYIPRTPAALTTFPTGLYQSYQVTYYGSTVWYGYANQPASQIINLSEARSTFRVTGSGVVADIDTGVDPNHPALKPVLLTGYDFTRNQSGASELLDLSYQASACNSCQPAYVNQSSAAMLDQSSAAMLDGGPDVAFGHGTEVMGVIHLVAPTAKLLPLKAFEANGTGNASDIIRAIYYAVQNGANVINMSFDMTQSSTELSKALNYATSHGVVCIASAGNDGANEIVYPAALQSNVAGVASTNDFDQRSSFSNYGNQIVWLAAPGEQIVTTYPFGAYAASNGTSFSAPFVSGTAALLINLKGSVNQSQAESAFTHEQYIGSNMGHGRLDVYRTLNGN